MTTKRSLASIAALAVLTVSNAAFADVKLPAIIGDNMVLQTGQDVPIWGTAEPGEKIEVRINAPGSSTNAEADNVAEDTRVEQTQADDKGNWRVTFKPMEASAEPVSVVITGANKITVQNVLLGDVWVCSGQSNMEWSVARSDNPEEEIQNAKHPKIRLFQVQKVVSSDKPLDDTVGQWVECSPETIANFSAVAYYFGRDLQEFTGQPVGLIQTAWGGTPAEAWTSREKLESLEIVGPVLERWKAMVGKDEKAKSNPHHPAGLFNGMINPIIPFAIKGAIWYQGESNASRAFQYRTLFPEMITDWRARWGQGDFPFLFVQLANFRDRKEEPAESDWAELREAQSKTLELPATGQAVIIDIGEAGDIHPRNKQDVGRRLALAARHVAFGDEDVVYSGPTFQGVEFADGKAILTFENVGGGLKAQGETLKGFAIAGEDKKFHWASAKIDGNQVIVQSDAVANPVAVRYAWADNPEATLYNAEGLPASPFRTDEWPGVTDEAR